MISKYSLGCVGAISGTVVWVLTVFSIASRWLVAGQTLARTTSTTQHQLHGRTYFILYSLDPYLEHLFGIRLQNMRPTIFNRTFWIKNPKLQSALIANIYLVGEMTSKQLRRSMSTNGRTEQSFKSCSMIVPSRSPEQRVCPLVKRITNNNGYFDVCFFTCPFPVNQLTGAYSKPSSIPRFEWTRRTFKEISFHTSTVQCFGF
jgi:hypothetical protein